MILVDTSVWIDHLRKPEVKLQELLYNGEVVTHALVRLELALGSIANRQSFLSSLSLLPHIASAGESELLHLVEARKLSSRGIGVVDLHLIASALLDRRASIWTRDRRLGEIAEEFGLREDFA